MNVCRFLFKRRGNINLQRFRTVHYLTRKYSSSIDEDFLPKQPVWSVQELLRSEPSESSQDSLSAEQFDKLLLLARLGKPLNPEDSNLLLNDLCQLNHFLLTLKELPLDQVKPLAKIESPKFFQLSLKNMPDSQYICKTNSPNVTKHTKKSLQDLFVVPKNS
ncbi:hypothetical protein DSO57_1022560 [Entomophthora muscae]|uniref:Uncharacterized protein n=1 Tax=Entomophthora muscae TaxID=34485 RepID=A0ACC2T417_9FUNG|nr:hypothetical protein DSO57_1022560 [Entomophthora muscae]